MQFTRTLQLLLSGSYILPHSARGQIFHPPGFHREASNASVSGDGNASSNGSGSGGGGVGDGVGGGGGGVGDGVGGGGGPGSSGFDVKNSIL